MREAASWPAPASHLVEEPLAEVLHGALELAALGLPLLVVPHVLGRGALPRGGPRVVVHIVEPASGVCALLPAENIKLRVNTATASPLCSQREISGRLARRVASKGLVQSLAQELGCSRQAGRARWGPVTEALGAMTILTESSVRCQTMLQSSVAAPAATDLNLSFFFFLHLKIFLM